MPAGRAAGGGETRAPVYDEYDWEDDAHDADSEPADSEDGEAGSDAGTSSAAEALVGLKQLEAHGALFQDLAKRMKIDTGAWTADGTRDPELNVVNIVITYDSKHCVALTADVRQELAQIQLYSLQTFSEVCHFEIRGTWVVMNDIDQNDAGDTMCVPYSDNGALYIKIFTAGGEELANLDMNAVFGMDQESKPIVGFYQPMLTACFVKDDDLFLQGFHRLTGRHYVVLYSYKTRQFLQEMQTLDIPGTTKLNFPLRSFYSSELDEVYTFYRQGDAVCQQGHVNAKARVEKITNADLGQMVLVYEKALISRSSNSMIFFKKEKLPTDDEDEPAKWRQYAKLDDKRGTLFFIRGNIRIQITTETKIYFYIIDKTTLMPRLENVMYNFMNCSSLMFGSRVRYGIAFKVSQPDFEIYTRSHYHNFKVCIDDSSFEGAVGCDLSSQKAYVMAESLNVGVYSAKDFSRRQSWTLEPDNDDVEVLYVTVSKCQKKLGMLVGRQGIRDQVDITEIMVYRWDERSGEFEREQQMDFEFDEYTGSQFFFNHENNEELFFFRATEITKLRYMLEEDREETVYTLKNYLVDPPNFGIFNKDQTKCIITSRADILFIDM